MGHDIHIARYAPHEERARRTTTHNQKTQKTHRPANDHTVLAATSTASATARLHVRRVLADWSVAGPDIDTVALVVSELTTNALWHGCPAGNGAATVPVRLSLRLIDSGVLVEVSDPSPRMPRPVAASAWEECGRGLHIVAALSSAWGATRIVADGEQIGKQVWARVPVRIVTDAGVDA